jgi:hypothetical protein
MPHNRCPLKSFKGIDSLQAHWLFAAYCSKQWPLLEDLNSHVLNMAFTKYLSVLMSTVHISSPSIIFYHLSNQDQDLQQTFRSQTIQHGAPTVLRARLYSYRFRWLDSKSYVHTIRWKLSPRSASQSAYCPPDLLGNCVHSRTHRF